MKTNEPSYRDPIVHRGWKIWLTQTEVLKWRYSYSNGQGRYGLAGSIEQAKADIDKKEDQA